MPQIFPKIFLFREKKEGKKNTEIKEKKNRGGDISMV
jgi:hypothetical protein